VLVDVHFLQENNNVVKCLNFTQPYTYI